MAVVIPPGYAECTVNLKASTTGRTCHNVFGFALTAPLTQSDVDSLSTALAAAYKPTLGSFQGRFNGIRVLEGQDGDPTVFESVSGNGAGTHAGDLMSPQVMALAKKTTGLASRAAQGRTFLIDPTESWVNDDGGLTGAAITVYTTFCAAVLLAFSTAGDPSLDGMVILHNSSRIPDPVTSYAIEAKVATLRPRYVR